MNWKDLIKVAAVVGALLGGARYALPQPTVTSTVTAEDVHWKLLKVMRGVCRNTAPTEATRLQCDN